MLNYQRVLWKDNVWNHQAVLDLKTRAAHALQRTWPLLSVMSSFHRLLLVHQKTQCVVENIIWDLVSGFNPSEKYESQLGLLFPIWGKKGRDSDHLAHSCPCMVKIHLTTLQNLLASSKKCWLRAHPTNKSRHFLARRWPAQSSRGLLPTCDLIWSDQGSDLWGLPWEECEFFIVSGWWLSPTPLKNMSSSVRVIIPSIWKNKKCSKPPTRFGSIHAQLLSIYQSCQEIGIGERTLMCKEVICKSSGRRFWGLGSCSGSKFQNQDPKHRSFQTTQFPETLHAKSKTVERSDGKRMCFFFLTHQTVRTLHGTSHRGMFNSNSMVIPPSSPSSRTGAASCQLSPPTERPFFGSAGCVCVDSGAQGVWGVPTWWL